MEDMVFLHAKETLKVLKIKLTIFLKIMMKYKKGLKKIIFLPKKTLKENF